MTGVIWLVAGLLLGGLLAWFWSESRSRGHLLSSRVEAEGKIKAAEAAAVELRFQRDTMSGQLESRGQEIAALQQLLKAEGEQRAAAETRLEELQSSLEEATQLRDRWGEMTLRRAAELAGMSEYCDFAEQESVNTDSGRLRPDMIVNLPGGRRIVVDAKVSLMSFLDAAAATTEKERIEALGRHSQHIRNHMNQLAARNYW